MPDRPGFHLEICGLEQFAAFCAIIRGADLNHETLSAMTERLTASTQALSDAEQANASPPVTPVTG